MQGDGSRDSVCATRPTSDIVLGGIQSPGVMCENSSAVSTSSLTALAFAPGVFDPLLDHALRGLVSSTLIDDLKQFQVDRNAVLR